MELSSSILLGYIQRERLAHRFVFQHQNFSINYYFKLKILKYSSANDL